MVQSAVDSGCWQLNLAEEGLLSHMFSLRMISFFSQRLHTIRWWSLWRYWKNLELLRRNPYCFALSPPDITHALSTYSNIPVTEDMGTYLGIPLVHGRIKKALKDKLLNKMQRKLGSWKAKTLSLPGRVTLAKSVLQAMPNYYMQSMSLPMSVCENLDRIVRRFIWGGD